MIRRKTIMSLLCILLLPNSFAAAQNIEGKIEVATSPTCATPNCVRNLTESKNEVITITVVEPSQVYQSVVYAQPTATAAPILRLATPPANSRPTRVLPGLNTESLDLDDFKFDTIEISDTEAEAKTGKLSQGEAISGSMELSDFTSSQGIELANKENLNSAGMLKPLEKNETQTNANNGEVDLPEPARHLAIIEGRADATVKTNSLEDLEAVEPQELVLPNEDSVRNILMNFSDAPLNYKPNPEPAVEYTPSFPAMQLQARGLEDGLENLVIHPPFIQPFKRDQHTFVIENKGVEVAHDVTVEVQVPATARIIAALPANSVFSSRSAVFQFKTISQGEKVSVHLNAVSRDQKTPISFIAKVGSKLTFEFDSTKKNITMKLSDTTPNYVRAEAPGTTVAEAAPGHGSLPAGLIRNPYFQNQVDQIGRTNAYGQRW